jgi:hypothetical protein
MAELERFLGDVKSVYKWLDEGGDRALILFSDDGDGLSSALLFKVMLDTLNIDYNYICLDKIYPEVIWEIFREGIYDFYIFLDLGGPIHKYIPRDSVDKALIIDHHIEYSGLVDGLRYLNPYLYGFDVESMLSTSIISYLIFREVGSRAFEWSWLGVVGFGEVPNVPSGLNWRVVYEAIRVGKIARYGKGFRVLHGSIRKDYRRLYKDITLISSAGYYKDSFLDLFNVLYEGDGREINRLVEEFSVVRKRAFSDLLGILEVEGLSIGNSIQWFEDYGKYFYDLGSRVFDSFVSFVSYQARLYDKNKYILGICERNPYIPGYGYLSHDWLNIAARTSKSLELRINMGRAQSVSALIEAAAYTVGGVGYGYESKGGAVIPFGSKDDFLRLFDKLASERVR